MLPVSLLSNQNPTYININRFFSFQLLIFLLTQTKAAECRLDRFFGPLDHRVAVRVRGCDRFVALSSNNIRFCRNYSKKVCVFFSIGLLSSSLLCGIARHVPIIQDLYMHCAFFSRLPFRDSRKDRNLIG